MKIGFVTSSISMGIQEQILKEGNELVVFLVGAYGVTTNDISGFSNKYSNFTFYNEGLCFNSEDDPEYLKAMGEFALHCDFIVFDYNDVHCLVAANHLRECGYEHKMAGPTEQTSKMEDNRAYGKAVAQHVCGIVQKDNTGLFFSDKESALAYAKTTDVVHVIKGHYDTMVPANILDMRDIIANDPFGLFSDEKFAGAYLEVKVDGFEVAFTTWFNGSEFFPLVLVNREYKGSHNRNMSGLMTGESGTVTTFYQWEDLPNEISEYYSRLLPLLKSNGYRGFIDINTIITDSGLNFLEWTTRFGYPTEHIMSMYCGKVGAYSQFLSWVARGSCNYSRDQWVSMLTPLGSAVTLALVHAQPEDTSKYQNYQPIVHGLDKLKDCSWCHFSTCYDADGNIRAVNYDRGVVISGFGSTIQEAREKVYSEVYNVYCWSHYFRDDVGHDFDSFDPILKKLNANLEMGNVSFSFQPFSVDLALATEALDSSVVGEYAELMRTTNDADDYITECKDYNPDTKFIVAKDGERLIAYLAYTQTESGNYIISTSVNNAYSGAGIGKALCEMLKSEGLTITLECRNRVLKFYTSQGFRIVNIDTAGAQHALMYSPA